MAFADPQSITIASVAQSLPRTLPVVGGNTYTKDDGSVKLTISGRFLPERTRVNVRVDVNKIAADPLMSANNRIYQASVFLVLDKPVVGYTNAEIKDVALALAGWCTSANLLKALGGES